MLRNPLLAVAPNRVALAEAFIAAGVDAMERAEMLSVERFVRLADELLKVNQRHGEGEPFQGGARCRVRKSMRQQPNS
jgi:hypothetical protein